MKLYIFLVFGITVFLFNCNTTNIAVKKIHPIDTLNINCTIIKFDSISDVYIIYAKKEMLTYKILTNKMHNKSCSQIKVGDNYYLKIKSLCVNCLSINSNGRYPPVDGIVFRGVPIKLERDSINELFQALNLDGLCIKAE